MKKKGEAYLKKYAERRNIEFRLLAVLLSKRSSNAEILGLGWQGGLMEKVLGKGAWKLILP